MELEDYTASHPLPSKSLSFPPQGPVTSPPECVSVVPPAILQLPTTPHLTTFSLAQFLQPKLSLCIFQCLPLIVCRVPIFQKWVTPWCVRLSCQAISSATDGSVSAHTWVLGPGLLH